MLVDTHCHIHEPSYPLAIDEVMAQADADDVSTMICIGTTVESSAQAIAFSRRYDNIHAAIGVHPHDTKNGLIGLVELLPSKKVVAIGEIGLDYFYTHSSRDVQIAALESQLQIAVQHNLPVVFHVREAFADFWPIFDNFSGLKGELHSFTDTKVSLDEALKRGLYIGVNGISTFTKDVNQQKMYDTIPLDKLLLETDAPFLTPAPLRGKVNQPAFVRIVAEYHAKRRNISFESIAAATTTNARALFAL